MSATHECTCTGHTQDAGGGYFEYLLEPDPACPEHFPTRSLRWKIACVNWSHPTAPKAVAYALRDGVLTFNRFFDTHVEAVEFVDSKLPKKTKA